MPVAMRGAEALPTQTENPGFPPTEVLLGSGGRLGLWSSIRSPRPRVGDSDLSGFLVKPTGQRAAAKLRGGGLCEARTRQRSPRCRGT